MNELQISLVVIVLTLGWIFITLIRSRHKKTKLKMHKTLAELQIEESRLRHQGDYNSALRVLDTMIAIDDTFAPAFTNKGAILLMFKKYKEALPVLERARELNPDDGLCLNNCAFCYYSTGHPEKAVSLYHLAMEKDYNHEGVNYNLGLALFALGKTEEAIRQWKIALQKNPSYKEPSDALHRLVHHLKTTTPDNLLSNKSLLKQEYLTLYEQFAEKPISFKNIDGTNGDLNQRLDLLLKSLDTSKDIASTKIFIGVFPLQTFNAQAVKVESGFLILVNTGLMLFALQISALIASLVKAEAGGKEVPQDIKIREASRIFWEWAQALIENKEKDRLEFYPSEARLNFTHFLFASLVDFVIAHELGHILYDHFNDSGVITKDGISEHIKYYHRSWQQEFEADRFAIDLVKKIYHGEVHEESMYLGPALCFEIVETISEITVDTNKLDLHPTSEARRSAIITNTHSAGFYVRVPLVDNLVEIMSELRKDYG